MPVEKVRCPWARSPAMIAYHDKEMGQARSRRSHALRVYRTRSHAGRTLVGNRARATRSVPRGVFKLRNHLCGCLRRRRLGTDDERRGAHPQSSKASFRAPEREGSACDRERVRLAAQVFWDYVDGKPLVCYPSSIGGLLDSTPIAAEIAKDLQERGFRFVGPRMIYAFLQAVGIVQGHFATCFLAGSTKE
jgi:hypothetical protein